MTGLSDLVCRISSLSGHLIVRCQLSLGQYAIFQWPEFSTVESLQLCASLLLVLAAFIAPYSVWLRRRRYLAPKLTALYEHSEPMARLSSRSVNGKPTGLKIYDFHFLVTNVGRSPACKVVAEIVEFWYPDSSGKLVRMETFLPVYLRYHRTEQVDIHPERPYYWNIGYIPPRSVQNSLDKNSVYDAPGTSGRGLRFILDLYKPPHNQPNVLLRGSYGLKISLYSENAKPTHLHLEINWSGQWRATTEHMLGQIRIAQVKSLGESL